MRFYADFHVHSKYSRATSKDCHIENLAYWAKKKGLSLIGTGDMTHPEWRREIRKDLVENDRGLLQLKKNVENAVSERVPESCRNNVEFVLTGEVSTIYKSGHKTRKVHHLVIVPDIKKVDVLCKKLEKIGSLSADGRPILKIDSRSLLEIVLETGDDLFLIPAHIWTPWFSVLGSRSGFDSIEECYGDLTPYIFALETGLSSDPEMNWRISSLDKFQLVSNSDAHSPSKLGREATVFNCEMNYFSIKNALKTGNGLEGTVEFFPEEGKYYFDGHRKCNIGLSPTDSKKINNLCPTCNKLLTLGVLHRLEDMADREIGVIPKCAKSFKSFVPLQEILAEIHGVKLISKKILLEYKEVIEDLGPELFILGDIALDVLEKKIHSPDLFSAIKNMRQGKVSKQCGYDGVFGTIALRKEGPT